MNGFHSNLNHAILFPGAILGSLLFFAIACQTPTPPPPQPTPELVIQTKVVTQVVFVEVTAQSSTATPESANTSTPIPSPTPSLVPPRLEILAPPLDTEVGACDIITANGTHNLTSDEKVWIFLRDIYRNYYVQNPPIELLTDGTWEATNIRPCKEIRYIIAIYVNPEGNELVESWVRTRLFGAISEDAIKALPGSMELDRVRIITPGNE